MHHHILLLVLASRQQSSRSLFRLVLVVTNEKCTKTAKSGETALVEELTANALPGGDKAGSQGVQPLVNNLFHPSGAIKRGHKGCNPLSTMRSRYLRWFINLIIRFLRAVIIRNQTLSRIRFEELITIPYYEWDDVQGRKEKEEEYVRRKVMGEWEMKRRFSSVDDM